MKRKLTSVHIFVLRQIMEKLVKQGTIHYIYIDFNQAYNCINREQLWTIHTILNLFKIGKL